MPIISIKPGRPFWSGFTAFCSNMVILLGLDQLSLTQTDVQVTVNWSGAIIASLLVAAVVYGKAKIDSMNGKQSPETSRD
jgi:hypothetical protein